MAAAGGQEAGGCTGLPASLSVYTLTSRIQGLCIAQQRRCPAPNPHHGASVTAAVRGGAAPAFTTHSHHPSSSISSNRPRHSSFRSDSSPPGEPPAESSCWPCVGWQRRPPGWRRQDEARPPILDSVPFAAPNKLIAVPATDISLASCPQPPDAGSRSGSSAGAGASSSRPLSPSIQQLVLAGAAGGGGNAPSAAAVRPQVATPRPGGGAAGSCHVPGARDGEGETDYCSLLPPRRSARRRRLLPAAPHRQHVAAAAAAAATECFTPRAHHGCRSHCFACLQERSPIDFPQVRIRADGYKLVDLCTAGSVAVLLQHLGEGACLRRAGRRRRCLPPRLLLPRPRRGCSLPCSPLPLPSAGVDHAAAQPPPRHLPRV